MKVKLMHNYKFIFVGLILFFLSGCIFQDVETEIVSVKPMIEIQEPEKESQSVIKNIITVDKKMALTFNGLATSETMIALLDELDRFEIKATFFLQGMRIAEDPEVANEIIKRGHTVQNNTLNHVLTDNLTYEEAFVELELANKVFDDFLDIQPAYTRSRSGDSSIVFEKAAAQLDMTVVSNTINPKDSNMQSAREIADYVKRFASRGAVIQLNTYINPEIIPAIELIYQDATEAGYTLTTLEDVYAGSYISQDPPPTNNLQIQPDIEGVEPNIIYQFDTTEKEIVLTFDDWAGDQTTSAILEILDHYEIKATFFLIGSGVERNPQLARLILDHGHEIASHSYHHKVVTEMEPELLQEDVVKNDQVLSYALQEKPANYFRTAQGVIDGETAKLITATGVDHIVLFDVASHDWDLSLTEDEVFERVVTRTGPGSILGLHVLDDSHVLNVLPRIIEYYEEKGYTFKTISKMIELYDGK